MTTAALIDACVMESFFRDSVAQTILSASFPAAPQTGLSSLLSLNAPSHPIRQRLDRIVKDSPDLLAVIKQEGKV
jgi:hypothetical protein